MPDPVADASRLAGSPAWVFLDDFATFGKHRNHTTAAGLTSFNRSVWVTFDLVDPPGVSRRFVRCPCLKRKRGFNGPPHILNAAGPLVIMSMLFLRGGGLIYDHFVYRAGPGTSSLDLIPGPCMTVAFPKQVGILPGGGGYGEQHYSVVFPRCKPRRVFSSESQTWSTKAARISRDPETKYHEVAMHLPNMAVAAAAGSLAWIDLWRGILLCDGVDEQNPVLWLIKWPVPARRNDNLLDIFSGHGSRDATLCDGVIRFVEQKFYENCGACCYSSKDARGNCWTVTTWKRTTRSLDWIKCSKADIVDILGPDGNTRNPELLGRRGTVG